GETQELLREKGTDIFTVLAQNDAYHALETCGGLIVTGATGTNVNDVAVLLLD
ncbi:MAG: MOFRL family protein, partial [Oscillospiraceae bacterium]